MISWLRKISGHVVRLFKSRPRGTIRTTFSISLLGLLLTASVIGTDTSHLKLQVSDTLIAEGERFAVEVIAVANTPVNAVDVTVQYDSDLLEIVSIDRGNSVLTIWTDDPIVDGDEIILRGGTFRRGFIGEHNIATIEFLPKQSGATTFTLTDVLLLAGDGAGTPIETADSLYSSVDTFIYDDMTDLSTVAIARERNALTDVDGNGRVDLVDVSAFMGAWANRERVYDFNGDGRMTFRDFSILLARVFTGE